VPKIVDSQDVSKHKGPVDATCTYQNKVSIGGKQANKSTKGCFERMSCVEKTKNNQTGVKQSIKGQRARNTEWL
jgi:hypothetical protein